MLDVDSNVPWWLPLSVLVWAVQMAVFHGVGLFFEWSDRTGRLASFKVRDIDRLGYCELLPRVHALHRGVCAPVGCHQEPKGMNAMVRWRNTNACHS
jgi:hypothetical protein